MPPRRARISSTTGRPTIDGVEQYANQEVFDAYCEKFKETPVHRARGLDFNNCSDDLLELVDFHGWRTVFAKPSEVNASLVREFYAYLSLNNDRNTVRIRGKPVCIAASAINFRLGLEDPELENEYSVTFDGSDAWLEAVGIDLGIIWTMGPEARTFIEPDFTTWEDKCLHRLIRSHVFPALHIQTVYYAHAALMYWLKKGWPVNVGALISKEMRRVALAERHSLPFGALITAMCKNAECPLLADDVYVDPLPILSLSSVKAPAGQAHYQAGEDYDAQYPDPDPVEPPGLPSTSAPYQR